MLKPLVLALGMALSATQFAYAAPIDLAYAGQTIQLSSIPKKLAVYDLAALDTLNALDIAAQIVPESTFSGTLANYQSNKAVLKAGSLFEPKLDLLKEAQPDLIIVGGRSASKVAELKNLAPTLNLSPNTDNYLADLTERTHLIANTFGKQSQAEQQLAKIAQLQQQLKTLTAGKSGLMLFAMGENFMPHASNDRFGFVYDFSGLQSVLPLTEKSDAPRPEAGSAEAKALAEKNLNLLKTAMAKQPDYLIVLDRGAINQQAYTAPDNIKKHPVLGNIAGQQKVIFVDADSWYLTGAGLANTQKMLEELIQAIGKKAA